MKFYHMTLLFFPMLLFVVGCGDSLEDSETNILDPNSADPHFQNLPLAGGSLIPLDEIPVITIEKTREDDEFYYWQLKANPVPIHEDLVVGITFQPGSPVHYQEVKLKNLRGAGIEWKDQEITLGFSDIDHLTIPNIGERLKNEGYFPNFENFRRDIQDFVVVIPKRQNTSQEFKLPRTYVLEENQFLTLLILKKELEEFTDNEDVKGYINIECEVVEDVIWNITYTLGIKRFLLTAKQIVTQHFKIDPNDLALFQTVPIFQTFEGYIIREGFALSYYMLGESSSLELKPPTDPE